MKTKTKTIRGWANKSDLLFSQNSGNIIFTENFRELESRLIKDGYKQLNIAFDTLRGKNATAKVVVKGWHWRGSWSDPTKEIYAIFYK